ncbi:HET-domain-containing protein, partial [Zopfia rhizophila CBS 207.26]
MRLLRTKTLELSEFLGSNIPPYAILSHTWGAEEVSFDDMNGDRGTTLTKAGYRKIRQCCEKALLDGFDYLWVDTCCIDKRSSVELSEAINAMFKWYQNSAVCYAYLADVPSREEPTSKNIAFAASRWFTRGWTLQELIAPLRVHFL